MAFNSADPGVFDLYMINLFVTLLSLAASSLMIIYIMKTKRKTPILNFILVIAISDLFYSIANLLSIFETETSESLCNSEAFIRQFFFSLSILMAGSISFLCYRLIVQNKSATQSRFFQSVLALSILLSTCLALT